MTACIFIAMDNAAFADNPHELSDILEKLAEQLRKRSALRAHGGPITDSNGNTVGRFRYSTGCSLPCP